MERKPGERVKVVDNTTVHGETGTILRVHAGGMIVVELDSGVIWPTFSNEIEAANSKDKDTKKRLP